MEKVIQGNGRGNRPTRVGNKHTVSKTIYCVFERGVPSTGSFASACEAGIHGGINRSIAALKTNTTLKILDLSFNRIGDEGIHALKDARKVNNTLKSLELVDNNHDLFKRYPSMMKSKRVSSIKRSPVGRKSPKRSPFRDKRAKKSKRGSGHSIRRAKKSARRVKKSPRRKSTKRR